MHVINFLMQGADEKKMNTDDRKKGETSTCTNGRSQQKENVSELCLLICTTKMLNSYTRVQKERSVVQKVDVSQSQTHV